MSASHEEIMALHRYFIWADRMRVHFYELLAVQKAKGGARPPVEETLLTQPYMSYWYGGTYVLIEGWRELNLNDPEVDRLLESPNVEILRRYRNGAFHFQRQYFDTRFLEFTTAPDGESALWIAELRESLSKWFLAYFERLKAEKGGA